MATLYQLKEGLVKADQEGNQEHIKIISDAIREHPTYQKQGQDALSKGFKGLSGDKRKEAIKLNTAKAIGIKPSELDSTRGMGILGRTKLSFQPTQQDKVKHLEDTYGRENLRGIDIGGSVQFLYRDKDETDNKWRRVDEQGVSLADFTADIAGIALPTTAAVGAAALSGGLSIPATAALAAGAGFTTGVAQDVATRAISKEDIQVGEIAKRQAITNAIGIPIDMVTGVGSTFLVKTIGRREADQASRQLLSGINDIVSKYDPGAKIGVTAAQEASTDASLRQSIRAGLDPSGPEARLYELQRDEILKLQKAIKGEQAIDTPIEDVLRSVADRQVRLIDAYEARVKKMVDVKAEAEALAKGQTAARKQQIKKKLMADAELELKAMRDQAAEGIRKFTKGRSRLTSTLGDDIRKQQEEAFIATRKANSDMYEEAYRRLKTPNSNTPVSRIQKVLDKIDDAALDQSAPELAAIQRLRARVSDSSKPAILTFRELDRYLREITDKINYKKKVGVTQSEFQLQKIGRRLDKLRDNAMGPPRGLGDIGAGTSAKTAYNRAKENYRKKVLPYYDGDRALNLSRVMGGSAESVQARGENVLNRTFSTRDSVRDAIRSGVSRSSLKEAYAEKIVQDSAGGTINYDPNIIKALYSSEKNTQKVISDLNRINRNIESGKLKAKVSADDINNLLSEFDPPARARINRAINEKQAVEAKLKNARNSALNKIIKGEMPAPEDIHHLISDISNLRPSQIIKLMDRLPNNSARASLRRSAIDFLYEEAGQLSAKAQRSGRKTGRETLWEPDVMNGILSNSKRRAQLEALIGAETVKDIGSLNKWLLSASEIRETTREGIGRFVTSTGASGIPSLIFVSPQLPRWLGRKMLGIIHTSPLARGILVRSLKDGNVDQELFERLFYMTMGTQRGMDAITSEMTKDPSFSEWMQETMRPPMETSQGQ